MLWDNEFRPLRDDFDRVPEPRRHAVAVAAVERTLADLTPPLGGGPGAELFRRTFDLVRNSDPATVSLPAGMEAELSDFLGDNTDGVLGPLLMAAVTFLGAPGKGMSGEALFTVFSHCYEAVHGQEEIAGGPLGTVDAERADPRLTATIAWQKELLARR
jgi:hypothetical protein